MDAKNVVEDEIRFDLNPSCLKAPRRGTSRDPSAEPEKSVYLPESCCEVVAAQTDDESTLIHTGMGHSEDLEGMDCQEAMFNVTVLSSVLTEMGKGIGEHKTILDFGSGSGEMVYAFRKLGYKAFGTDLEPASAHIRRLVEQEALCSSGEAIFNVASGKEYRIPFPDCSFDYVISWNVIEHVPDHTAAFAEIGRVMKPGACGLHVFPSRYRVVEPHINIPFGGVFRSFLYLYFWALIGIGSKSWNGCTPTEIASKNQRYMSAETNYLTEGELMRLLATYFVDIRHVEKHFWKYRGGRGGTIYSILTQCGLSALVPIAASIVSRFGYRALYFAKPK